MYSSTNDVFAGFLIFLMLNLFSVGVIAQETEDIFDLGFKTQVNCGENLLSATIQIRAQGDTFKMGTSSVLFNYDEEVLEFLDYQSINFDPNSDCIPGFTVWEDHQFNASLPGTCNLTLLAAFASASCPIIGTDWMDIGVAKFKIKNINGFPNLDFNVENSNVNRHEPNDGSAAPKKGQFIGYNDKSIISCSCNAPLLNNDTIVLDCPKASFEAQILQNDIVSNPTFSIVNDPAKGTAIITEAGILKYTTDTPFCGEDTFSYKVCNDGNVDCCAEAVVTILIQDALQPIFLSTPGDLTVSADQISPMASIPALDNCAGIEVHLNEEVIEGECPISRILVRTWTAEDLCGNQTVHTQKISVENEGTPTIECPATLEIPCTQLDGETIFTDAPLVDGVSTSDNSSLDGFEVSFVDEELPSNCSDKISRQFYRIWTVKDKCGNSRSCNQLVKIIDETLPQIICPEDVIVNCGEDIRPGALGSEATASAACSEIRISYTDNAAAPTDCTFEEKIIIRTWVATDACGNTTECEQKIIIKGIPCPSPDESEKIVYRCEKEVINFRAILDLPETTEVAIFNKNTQDPVFNIVQYALPSTGCEIGHFEFNYKIYNDRQCLIENSTLIIKTIPRIIANTIVEEDNCTAKLVMECPDLYGVTWKTDTDQGIGNEYVAQGGTTENVIFKVNFKGLELPASLELPCLQQYFEVVVDCPEPCPPGIEETITISGCKGDFVNLRERLDLLPNQQLEITGFNPDQINLYPLNSDVEGCGITEKTATIIVYNEANCPIRYINLIIHIINPIKGEIIQENDFCKVKLRLDCPENYDVFWGDNLGNNGIGTVYEAAPGTAGVVTFEVVHKDTTIHAVEDNSCLQKRFQGDFSCRARCPEVDTLSVTLRTCSGSELDLKNRLELASNYSYSYEFPNTILGIGTNATTGIVEIGNAFGCQFGEFIVAINAFDENQCLVKHIYVVIIIVPEIYGEIQYESDSTYCKPSLVLECETDFKVTWKDNHGTSGEGNTYMGTTGSAGYVTFYVRPNFGDLAALPCAVDSFFADYSCRDECPETLEKTKEITVCAGTEINLFERLDLTTNKHYVFDNEAIKDGIYSVGNPFGCEIGQKEYLIKVYSDRECLLEILKLKITVLPTIYAEVFEEAGADCVYKLGLECPENYNVTWEDSNGKTGEGTIYIAEPNTAGIVTFHLEFASPTIILSEVELACFTQSFRKEFNCIGTEECPETRERTESFTVCAATRINIFDFVDLPEGRRYVYDSEAIIDGIYNVGNPFGCEIGIKEYVIKAYDEKECLLEIIHVKVTVLPAIFGGIEADTIIGCEVKLFLECEENYEVTWEDTDGNTGEGLTYTPEANTSGSVTFSAIYKTPGIILSAIELACLNATFEADYNCTRDCPQPELESLTMYGCHEDIINLYERLNFSDNFRYKVIDNPSISDLKAIALENLEESCELRHFELAIQVINDDNCIQKLIIVNFYVLPKIIGTIVNNTTDCGVKLELNCPEKFEVSWKDNLGNEGLGTQYLGEGGTTGEVIFKVSFKDPSLVETFANSGCLSAEFIGQYGCCEPEGTTCDDGNPDTFGDQEDGNCGCAGIKCEMEHKGKVRDASELGGCGLIIVLSDRTKLEPAILPEGTELIAGQEIIFSYVTLKDRASLCSVGEVVHIICFENTCPEKGTPCTDGDLSTINDAQDGNCNCIGESLPEPENEIDLRFRPELNCVDNVYCVTLQGKAQKSDLFIGTSSILVNYNSDALEFANYTSTQFDEKETCIQGTMSPWDAQMYDGTSVPGKFNLTLSLKTAGLSCPEITTKEWEDFGVICFDIMDNQAIPELTYNKEHTQFNSHDPNDGSIIINPGRVHEINNPEALNCTDITSVDITSCQLSIKAFLQGPYQANRQLMGDKLRINEFVPLNEPYTALPNYVHFGKGGGETILPEVLQVTGNEAIVDWVMLEIRSAASPEVVLSTRSALIQRDGDIVDTDGVSPVAFDISEGSYYVAVKHRNHLGVMTAEPIDFSKDSNLNIDFTNPNTPTYGTNAQLLIRNKMVLRGGNASGDRYIILAGGGLGLPDRDVIFFDIFLTLWYANPDDPITYNSVVKGYYGSDTNMDGKVKYQGPKNDIDAIIFFNVLFHPENTAYRLNFAIEEQIP